MFVTNNKLAMSKKFLLICLFISTVTFAQYGYRDGNRIGLSAGISQTTLFTNNFKAKPEMGFAGGLSVRGNYYNNWSMIFGMQFFANNFSLESTLVSSLGFVWFIFDSFIVLSFFFFLSKNFFRIPSSLDIILIL